MANTDQRSMPDVLKKLGLTGRLMRRIRESSTAYLFLLPAFFIIGMFGLFPMLFSVYVSLHHWRIKPGDYAGLANYVKGLDNLAYIIALWLVVLLITNTIKSVMKNAKLAKEHNETPWLWMLPSVVTTAGIFLFVRFIVLLLPEVLAIADKIRSLPKAEIQSASVRFLLEAWRVPTVGSARFWALLALISGGVLAYVFTRYVARGARGMTYYSSFVIATLTTGIAIGLSWLTFNQIQLAYAEALADGEIINLWPQIISVSLGIIALIAVSQILRYLKLPGGAKTALMVGGLLLAGALKLTIAMGNATLIQVLSMTAGVALLFVSWIVWQNAQERTSSQAMLLWLAGAIFMMIASWVLIGEVPRMIDAGYEDWWKGLQVTIYYSLFTVPVQLSLALFIAVLLFQEIKGKSLFRLIYFLPYITSPVASAGIFRVLFSGRPNGPVNNFITTLGFNQLLWLDEPQGIFQMLAGSFVDLPDWLAGPSLALIVIVIFNIWTFFGYNAVIFLAGLGAIPKELYEAASIDGAGRWSQFRHITFPLLSPTTYFLILIAVIGTFKAFTHVWVLRSGAALGTTDTASIIIFNEFNRNTRYGFASSLALVLMGLVLVLTVINNRIAEEKVFYG